MQPNGFNNGYSFANILKNGTIFFGGLPELGYDDGEELSDNIKRKQYGLAEKKEEFIPQDDSAGMSHFSFTDLPPGLTRVEATISTSADQSAIAPGYLEKSWQQNGRNYYHYVLENPIYPSFPIMSARYSLLLDSVKSGDGQTTNIELYYHREHNANLSRFMNGCKDAIGYLSKTFGSFPFRQMRLAESSIYTGDRNSFPDLLAYSERYGWNVSFDNPDQFDYCYFFTLCYVGNQWWLYQTAPNHTIGSEIISDGLSKYGAFLLFEKKYGIASMKKVLNNEANWYLLQRRFSFEKENPMIESKRYWEWDTKAGVILYELKELIGEDSLNASLREFHDAYAFRDKAPFAGSNDLYRFIKKRVPDSLQYYLTDSWEKITIYDNKILDANVVSLGEDKYKVQIKVSVGKTYTDSLGNDKPAAEMNDYIDIGIFAAETKDSQGHIQDHPAYLQKHRFTAGEHTIDIIVNGKPASVGIDPYGKLIDRRTDDNLKTL